MAERYIATEKTTGKELLNMEFTKADEAVEEVRKLFASGAKPDEIDVKIDPGNDLPPVPVTPEQLKRMARQPRSDKGQPHSKKQKSGKKTRNRGQFFVVPDNTPVFTTRQELNTYLDSLEKEIKVRVGQGHVFKPERKVQFSLRPIKEK